MFKDQMSIMLETWPKPIKLTYSKRAQSIMQTFNNVYDFIRELRIKNSIKQATMININLITNENVNLKEINDILVNFNIHIDQVSSKQINPEATVVVINKQMIEYVNNFSNDTNQIAKIEAELKRLTAEIERSKNILNNKQFIAKAPKEKVAQEQQKYQHYLEQFSKNSEIYKKIVSKK
jgi:valyl-tRNA synthetase